MTEYSMTGALPLKTIKRALLSARSDGRLERVKLLDLTNCTFDGHIYNTRRVMEECLAIKPDLIFLWDEAWFGFARFSPFHRRRTGMGAAQNIEEMLASPGYRKTYEEWKAKMKGKVGAELDPSDPSVLDERLLPDPDTTRLRVYQTNSTLKALSALRTGTMIFVLDQDLHH